MEQETTTIKRTWVQGLLTPQTFVYLMGAMVAVVIFWTRTQESWAKQKELERIIETLKQDKADKADMKPLEDRVSRQYETSNKLSDRITTLEKASEYQRGLKDGEEKK